MTITLDRGPQDVSDMLRQLNVLREQINALISSYNDGAGTTGSQIVDASGNIIAVFSSDGSQTEFDLLAPGGDISILAAHPTYVSLGAGVTSLLVDFSGGFAFGDLPAHHLGQVAIVTNSDTQVWGATIGAASPGNPVLAFDNGTNWTVIGK